MKTIATMLEEGVIDLSLKASRKKQAIKELAALLAETKKVSDCEKIAKAVLAREKVASTGIGHGIAIPHKLSPSVQETVMIFGRSKEGIAFDAIDRKPAHLLFFIVGPENSSADHLKLLSRLSRLLTQESFRDQLLEARSPEEVVALFRNNEES